MEALDVVFGIDMSSRSTQHYPQMKGFLTQFADALSANTKYLNLGALKYGSEAVVTFPYQSKPAADAFARMVGKLTTVDNGRAVDAALVKAYEAFFKPRHNENGKYPGGYLSADRINKIVSGGTYFIFAFSYLSSTKKSNGIQKENVNLIKVCVKKVL